METDRRCNWYHREYGDQQEMALEDHCRMDDNPPTDGILGYGPQNGRTEAEKGAFIEEVDMMAGLSDGQTMLCVAGDFNAHMGMVELGDEESVGRFGWGTMNREGRELVEMSRRNGLAVAGTFFQKKRATESHTGADGTIQSST